jgi:hypothetical protein
MAMYVPKLARLVIEAALEQPNPSADLKVALHEYLNVYEGSYVETARTQTFPANRARAKFIGAPTYQSNTMGG